MDPTSSGKHVHAHDVVETQHVSVVAGHLRDTVAELNLTYLGDESINPLAHSYVDLDQHANLHDNFTLRR